MNDKDPSTYKITFTTLAYGGEALGRLPDGRAVFVPFALPGEVARIRLSEEKRRYARGELLEVLEPSPERIPSVCTHFGECGGCHYQSLSYEAQLKAKKDILRDQLERIGKLSELPIQPVVPSPDPLHYRNHVQFHLTRDGRLGYHKSRSNEVFPIQECHLPEDQINALWPQLDFEAIPELERIGLRLGVDDEVQMILESRDPQPPQLSVEDLPVSVVHISQFGALVLVGSERVVIEVAGTPFRVSAASFFQVNTHMAGMMVEHLLSELPRFHRLDQNTTIIDAYCGAGLFSAFLAPHVDRLIGIEVSPSAADDYVSNLDRFDNVEMYEAKVEDVLPQIDAVPQVVIVDPPRAGIDRHALDSFLRLAPDVFVYVSCDPATLARDARRLTDGGYRLKQITPFDMFPQTYHIESISFWVRQALAS